MTNLARVAAASLAALVPASATRAAEATPALVSLSERTDSGKLVDYPESSIVDVDVNSSVRLQLSPNALAALSRAQRVPPEERARVLKDLKDLAQLQKDLNAAAQAIVDASRARTDAQAKGVALAGESLARYRAAYAALAKAFVALKGYMGDERYNQFVRATVDAEEDTTLAAVRFVADEHRRLQQRVQEDADAESGRVLTITASIGNPPRSLHVPGYDDLGPGVARPVDKTRFTFDERFAEEHAAAQALARSAGDWNRLRDAALEAVRRKLSDVLTSLGAVATDANALAVKAEKDAAPGVKAAAADVRKAAEKLRKALEIAGPALRSAISPPGGADPADLLASVVGALQEAAPQVTEAAEILVKAAVTLEKASPAVMASADKLSKQVAELVSRTLGPAFIASKPAITAPQPSSLRVKLAAARDTEVSLLVADRADGDVVTLTTRVLDVGADGEAHVAGTETTRYLRVRSRGFVADTGAVVLFTRPLKRDPGPFVPAAGAFAVFRFKGYRNAGEANSNFWYYAAPGLGVSAIAIPRSSDGSTQIAWMGTVHVFGDVLQASLGTTTDAAPVWGIGLGLHRIAGLGKYFQ